MNGRGPTTFRYNFKKLLQNLRLANDASKKNAHLPKRMTKKFQELKVLGTIGLGTDKETDESWDIFII
jgi:hypothetical protein